jgi:20S proteasome subunit beta 7
MRRDQGNIISSIVGYCQCDSFMHLVSIMLAINAAMSPSDPTKRTLQPIVTGTTVIGIKYNDGVMLAADTLASYGSLARYKDVRRIQKVGDNTLVGASGELSDFQAIMEMLDRMHQSDVNQDDGYTRNPSEVYNYLRAVMYQRRNKGNLKHTNSISLKKILLEKLLI